MNEPRDPTTDDPRISAAHAAGREVPPEALDDAVLAHARRSLVRGARWRKLGAAVATAAVMVLGLAVTLQVLLRPAPLPPSDAPTAVQRYAVPADQPAEQPADRPSSAEREQLDAPVGGSAVFVPTTGGEASSGAPSASDDSGSAIVGRAREGFLDSVSKPELATPSAPVAPVVESFAAEGSAREAPAAPVAPAAASPMDAADATAAPQRAAAASARAQAPTEATLSRDKLRQIERDIAERSALLDKLQAEGRREEYDAARAAFCHDYPDQPRCR